MTLVIVTKVNNQIQLCCDTRLSTDYDSIDIGDNQMLEKPAKGYYDIHDSNDNVLKTAVCKIRFIFPHLAVCFAGNVKFAKEAFINLPENYEDWQIDGYFFKKHQECKHETDYIIANAKTGIIFRITDGKKSVCNNKCFIGNPDVYSYYKELVQTRKTLPQSFGNSSDEIFREIIESNKFADVGNYPLYFIQEKDKFIPQIRFTMSYGGTFNKIIPANTPMPLASTVDDIDSVEQVASFDENGQRKLDAVVIYRYKFGFIFFIGREWKDTIKITGADAREFTDFCKRHYNLDFRLALS